MPLEREYRPENESAEVQTIPTRWQECGALLANHFSHGRALLLDVDGVICKADALDRPELTVPEIIPSLQRLENLRVKIGVATARGTHIIDYLRHEHQLRMEGPAILEEGQVLIREGEKEYLATHNHMQFIADVRRTLLLHQKFQDSWQKVRLMHESAGTFTFCPGNFQWQGECRASFWFFAHEEETHDHEIVTTIFEPVLRELARHHCLDYERDLAVSVSRMSVGNLGILSIKGKVDGLPVNKGVAAKRLNHPWVFAADGFGDTSLAIVTKKANGVVIGIEGNLDISSEPPEFLGNADFVLSDPEELTSALGQAAVYLETPCVNPRAYCH